MKPTISGTRRPPVTPSAGLRPDLSVPRPAAPSLPPAMECWRVARVAKLLDVSKKRVYQLIQQRRLEVIRLGPRQTRVLKRSLERYVGRLLEDETERDY